MVLRLGSANVLMLGAHVATIGALGIFAPPAEFGLFLLALSVSLPFSAFAGLRFESALPSVQAARELNTLLAMASGAILFVCLLQLGIIAWLAELSLFELEQLDWRALGLLICLTLTQSLIQIGRLWAVRHGAINAVARATVVRAISTLLVRGSVLAGLVLIKTHTMEWVGLALILGELLIAAVMAANIFPFGRAIAAMKNATRRNIHAALRRNWKFPLLETPSTMLDSLAANAPILLVTQFFGLTATASFGLAYRGLAVPVAQLSRTLTEVMQTRYSQFQRERDWQAFERLFWLSSLIASALALFFLAVAGLAAVTALEYVPEGNLREFLWMALIISPWVASSAVVNINSRLLLMLKRQELKLVYDLTAVCTIAALWLAYEAFLPSLRLFVLWISFAQALAYVLYWILIFAAIRAARRAET